MKHFASIRQSRREPVGHRRAIAAAATALLLLTAPARAQIKSFPQAEGYGAAALGGRGGDVYHVTNLTDVGVGSLRYGVENAPSGGRTIVFDVGGWINLTTKLGVTKNRITIAGQTAPGGVGVRGAGFSVGGDDVVVRHMRFRPGKGAGSDSDSVNTNENAQRVIYDHISAEFSTDGGFDLQAGNVTLQYSSVSFGLLTHSTGGLIQSPTGGAAGLLSFHHNMFAHNQTRNPKARAELIDWRDNVVYNYHNGFLAGETDGDVNPNWRANFDGNTYISNSGGNSSGGGRPMMTGGRTQNYDLWYGVNALDRDSDSTDDPIVYTRAQAQSNQSVVSSAYNWFDQPFAAADVWQSGSPAAAYTRVLAEFGATPWSRDAVNQLIHDQVLSRTGVRIERESDLPIANAGYPDLNPNDFAAPLDSDGDGIPNAWEERHGLPTNAASNNGDFDNDGYTNLEEYLNDLAAFAAPGPIEFDGSGRYADWSNWTRRWEPSRRDRVHINSGTATVDAMGQRAGTLQVGASDGGPALLAVSSGRLEVAGSLIVFGGGVVNQTGGDLIVDSTDVTIAGDYFLSGGKLSTPILSKSHAGEFQFTGGALSASYVNFDLVNHGGVLSPATALGQLHVNGDLTLDGGVLKVEIGSDLVDQFDYLRVEGVVQLSGTLRVELIDLGAGGYNPQLGDQFPIIAAQEGIMGAFASFDLPELSPGLSWSLAVDATTALLSVIDASQPNADFNADGMVDGADFLAWQRGFALTGQTGNMNGDANADGLVNAADLAVWQSQFGGVASLSPANATVPEPTVGWMLAPALLVSIAGQRRSRRR
jgi:hypothetical protein